MPVLFFTAIALAALSLAAVAQTAAPTPDPSLKEIGRVRSTIYCSMLSKRVAPTLQGLIKNDEAIGAGHRVLSKMSDDAGEKNPARLDLDRHYLSQVVMVTAHNLDVIKQLMNDPNYFKEHPVTDDERSADDLRKQLKAVAAEQNSALNLLNGALESDLMGQMQSERSMQMQAAAGAENATPQPAVDPTQFMTVAGLPDHPVSDQFSKQLLSPGSMRKHTIYDALAAQLEVNQRQVAVAEKTATQAVVAAVPLCTSPQEQRPTPFAPTVTPAPEKTPIQIVIPPN